MILEKEYALMPYVTRQRRWEISNKLQLSERQVRLCYKIYQMYIIYIFTLIIHFCSFIE
ncbi:uncharacterized protein DC041_0001881 [Schistosoma bovis]|nr:uncharacterized protein DC041_0001881 [Schistosoma bovis]